MMKKLDHPNIVRLFETNEDGEAALAHDAVSVVGKNSAF